jgi:hypothetical protein
MQPPFEEFARAEAEMYAFGDAEELERMDDVTVNLEGDVGYALNELEDTRMLCLAPNCSVVLLKPHPRGGAYMVVPFLELPAGVYSAEVKFELGSEANMHEATTDSPRCHYKSVSNSRRRGQAM